MSICWRCSRPIILLPDDIWIYETHSYACQFFFGERYYVTFALWYKPSVCLSVCRLSNNTCNNLCRIKKVLRLLGVTVKEIYACLFKVKHIYSQSYNNNISRMMKIELLELHKQLITDVNFSTPFSLENLHLYTRLDKSLIWNGNNQTHTKYCKTF